jgi:hypothetical protein
MQKYGYLLTGLIPAVLVHYFDYPKASILVIILYILTLIVYKLIISKRERPLDPLTLKFFYHCSKEEIAELEHLAVENKLSIKDLESRVYYGGINMLIYSIAHEKPKMVDFLLKNGFDPNWRLRNHDDTAIFYTIHKNNEELFDIVTKYNVDFNLKNSYGMTPLYHIIYRKKQKLLEKLFDKGFEFNMAEYEASIVKYKGEIPTFKELDVKIKRVIASHLCKIKI